MVSKRGFLFVVAALSVLAGGCGMNSSQVKPDDPVKVAEAHLEESQRLVAEAEAKRVEAAKRALQLARAGEGIAEDWRKLAEDQEKAAAAITAKACSIDQSQPKCQELKAQAEAERAWEREQQDREAWGVKAQQPHLMLRIAAFELSEVTVVSSTLPSGSGFSYDVDADRGVVALKSGQKFVATFYRRPDFQSGTCVAFFADGQTFSRSCP